MNLTNVFNPDWSSQSPRFSSEAKFSHQTQNYCHAVLIKATKFTARLSNVFLRAKQQQCCYCFPHMFAFFSLPFPADICIPISESVLSPHISPLDEHNKHSAKEHSWRKSGKMHAKHPLKSKTCSYVIHSKKLRVKLRVGCFLSAFLIIIAWKAPLVHSLWVSRVHEQQSP